MSRKGFRFVKKIPKKNAICVLRSSVRNFIYFSIFIFPLLIFLFSCASTPIQNNFSNDDDSELIRLASDVSREMLAADFWISRAKNPDEIRMSQAEIAAWNRENEKINLPGTNFKIISDLRKIDSVVTSSEIRGDIVRLSQKNSWFKKVETKNGEEIQALTQKEIRAIYDKMNYSALEVEKDFPVKKAICVRRSDMRLVPDETFFSDDKEYWFDDIAQNSGILVGEPVLVLWESKGGDWLYVRAAFCNGWVRSADFAFCSDVEFERYFDYAEKNSRDFVTIIEERFTLLSDYIVNTDDESFGDMELFMGTFRFTASWTDFEGAFPFREPYASFLVELPYRKKDGSLGIAHASIPAGKCNLGLLDFTAKNVLNLAFKPLGNRYGWGGMAKNRDCSEYLKDIYRCFGFNFPRNSRAQLSMAGKTLDFEEKSLYEREKLISSLEEGTVMGFPGHVFMYLGNVDGKIYVISALGAYYEKKEEIDVENSEITNKLLPVNANSVNVNTLSVLRKNGKSWLEVLTQSKSFLPEKSWEDERIFINSKWQFAEFSKINSGCAFLYKSRGKRKNITVAVNAGHGTRGGSLQKTFSHPDKSPKVTGGTNASGSVESISVSDGMIFKDGKTESEVNLRTARLLKELLLKAGYDVLMIRDNTDVQFDNIARTVIANNNAKIHIAIHFDGDSAKDDKGCFYCSVPEEIKNLPNVKNHWKESERLGEFLIKGLEKQKLPIYNEGKMEIDLTQTSFSTIPTVDIELGNEYSETSTVELEKRAKGLFEGIESFFGF